MQAFTHSLGEQRRVEKVESGHAEGKLHRVDSIDHVKIRESIIVVLQIGEGWIEFAQLPCASAARHFLVTHNISMSFFEKSSEIFWMGLCVPLSVCEDISFRVEEALMNL